MIQGKKARPLVPGVQESDALSEDETLFVQVQLGTLNWFMQRRERTFQDRDDEIAPEIQESISALQVKSDRVFAFA